MYTKMLMHASQPCQLHSVLTKFQRLVYVSMLRFSIHDCQLIRWKYFADINACITFGFEIFIAPRAPAMMNA